MAKKTKTTPFETAGETYIPEGIVGEGLTGRVHKVVDSAKKSWALKCLKPDQATTSRTKRFLNELSFCQEMNHANVVKVVDNGYIFQKGTKCPFFVMQLYPKTLRDLIEAKISPDKVLRYLDQIMSGVEAAHLKNVLHRDLKPENILYDPATDVLIVSDFGIAHFTEETMHTVVETKPGERLANFLYSAPEQREKGKKVDRRADIYALGLMLNEMFTGTVIQGTGFKKIGKDASAYLYLDEIVEQMVKQNPEERPTTIDEIKKHLIARENDFISRQKLNELRKTVVPTSTVIDPLVEDPVKLVSVDVQGNRLIAVLNHSVHGNWIRTFQSIDSFTYQHGSEPVAWQFQGNEASVTLPANMIESSAKAVFRNVKDYIEKANVEYRNRLERVAQQKDLAERRALEEKVKEEEKRQRILKDLGSP